MQASLTGDARFDALALAYARANPTRDANRSQSQPIATASAALLPASIEGCDSDPRYAYFCDVARPECAPHVAHVAFVAIQRGETLDHAFAVDSAFDFARQWRMWIVSGAVTGLRVD